MCTLFDDLDCPADHFPPPRRMQRLEARGDHRHVAGADLERAVTAEGTARATLQVPRLRPYHRSEVLISSVEDLSIVVIGHART